MMKYEKIEYILDHSLDQIYTLSKLKSNEIMYNIVRMVLFNKNRDSLIDEVGDSYYSSFKYGTGRAESNALFIYIDDMKGSSEIYFHVPINEESYHVIILEPRDNKSRDEVAALLLTEAAFLCDIYKPTAFFNRDECIDYTDFINDMAPITIVTKICRNKFFMSKDNIDNALRGSKLYHPIYSQMISQVLEFPLLTTEDLLDKAYILGAEI